MRRKSGGQTVGATGGAALAAQAHARARRRYHFGSAGFVYVFVTLLIALGAFNSQNNLLFWAFGFSLALLVVSGFLSGAMLMGVSVTRERIWDARAGGVFTVRYRVRNANRLIPVFALSIEEGMQAPGGVSLRRRFGLRRKAAAPAAVPIVGPPNAFVAHIGPRESIVAQSATPAHRRGLVSLRSIIVHTTFPFGIMRKSVEFAEPVNAVILPTEAPVHEAALTTTALGGESSRSSGRRGAGDEFHSLRDYHPGDSSGSIAWKASARRGHLLVRQTLAPAPVRVWIVLRLRLVAGSNEADERAISMAATLIRRAGERAVSVGLAIPLADVHQPPRADAAHIERLLRELGQIELGAADARGHSLPFPLAAATHRNSCICIHAGPSDPSHGPPDRVVHISAAVRAAETVGEESEEPTRGRVGDTRRISPDATTRRTTNAGARSR